MTLWETEGTGPQAQAGTVSKDMLFTLKKSKELTLLKEATAHAGPKDAVSLASSRGKQAPGA